MPTTSVRRLISPLRRSNGLMECRFAGKTWVEWPSDGAEPCGHLRRWPRRRSRPHAVDRRAPLGNSIDIEVDDPILGQIALDKSLVLRPQPFGDLAHRRAREQPTPAFVRKRVLDVTGRQPARIKLDCQILESLCATRQILSDLRDERSGVSRTCGAENSTVPSAVFIRPGLYPFR